VRKVKLSQLGEIGMSQPFSDKIWSQPAKERKYDSTNQRFSRELISVIDVTCCRMTKLSSLSNGDRLFSSDVGCLPFNRKMWKF